jgi:hypothetical protein
MTSMQNRGIDALPNVLRDQTRPNTLGGMVPAAATVPFRLPVGALVAAVIGILAALAIVLARPG